MYVLIWGLFKQNRKSKIKGGKKVVSIHVKVDVPDAGIHMPQMHEGLRPPCNPLGESRLDSAVFGG
jgi:hypothetical protein